MTVFKFFSLVSALVLSICASDLRGGEDKAEQEKKPKRFRTDADGPHIPNQKKDKDDDSPQWYQLVDGEFPPEGSAHAVSGELIQVDHLERRFQIRVDRNDSQNRGFWDLPLDAGMLPYGSIWIHGAPAALRDIPLGTHLHGLFYLKDPEDDRPFPEGPNDRQTPEADFRRCFRLEDDFTFHQRQGQLWKVDAVDVEANKLTAQLQDHDGKATGKPQEFDLLPHTRVFQGNGFAGLAAIEPGQTVLFNLTWVTLYGPGRILEIWLDEASRKQATARQFTRHHHHLRERGLPGWVTAVDDDKRFVTVTFFDNVDPELFEALAKGDSPVEWPFAKKPEDGTAPSATIVVARDTLMTYDPVNDRKRGKIFEMKKVPKEPGSSGVQIQMKVDMMLEGFRPRRVVRIYPYGWNVIALPREEQYFGRE